jgi:hypothetical protein
MEVSISRNGGKSAMNCIMSSCAFVGMGTTQEVDIHQPFFWGQFVARLHHLLGRCDAAKWSTKIQITINNGG